MQFLDGKLLFSASDLVNFLGCRHATYLDLRNLTDEVVIPERDSATVLIFQKGIEHETRYLAAIMGHPATCDTALPNAVFNAPRRL